MPGIASTGSTLTNGFDGQMMMPASRGSSSRRIDLAASARRWPRRRIEIRSPPARSDRARNNVGTRVRRRPYRSSCAPAHRSSAGWRTATPSAAASCFVTCVSVAPLRSRWVRSTCIARSRSPSRNHVSPPSFSSACMNCHVSPRRPQPVSVFDSPDERVHQRVDVGRYVQSEVFEVVAGVDDERELVGGEVLRQAERELRAADAARDRDEPLRCHSAGRPDVLS